MLRLLFQNSAFLLPEREQLLFENLSNRLDEVFSNLRRRAKLSEQDVDFVSDFHSAQRRDFLRSISVLSTPAPHGEAFGIQLIDAMAQGVPVVQPNVGAYPEIIQATGGGVLYDQEDPHGLADALRSLLCDPEKARALGQNGRNAVRGQFNVDRVAREMTRIYELVIAQAGK